MENNLSKEQYKELVRYDKSIFEEFKKTDQDIYLVLFAASFLKAAVQKTSEGAQIIYLDSFYVEDNHKEKLIGYFTFVIAERVNGKKGFKMFDFLKA